MPPPTPWQRGSDEVARIVARLADRGWVCAEHEAFGLAGLSLPQWRVLETLMRRGKPSEMAAADELAGAVEELATRHLVLVSRLGVRSVRVGLSTGGGLWEQLAPSVLSAQAREFDGIPRSDLDELSRILSWCEHRLER